MIAIAERRAPASIELDLQEVVEAVVAVVLGFGATTVAPKPINEWFRPDFIEPHGDS
jgi:hypothetical protein